MDVNEQPHNGAGLQECFEKLWRRFGYVERELINSKINRLISIAHCAFMSPADTSQLSNTASERPPGC